MTRGIVEELAKTAKGLDVLFFLTTPFSAPPQGQGKSCQVIQKTLREALCKP